MDIRSQVAMVFHLDKCIGCHTCSIACKNVWTDRKGAEYMWWNNVETKPGTGYPTKWEDQDHYKGGWEVVDGELRLKSSGKKNFLQRIFYQPNLPTLDEYYEPWTYDYDNLFTAPEGDDQPTARPVSKVTGEYIDIKGGPNWDDDLSGSPLYARNDPNIKALTPEQELQLLSIEQLVMFYLPRICNHCLNPACVASCPSGALYKRGEDGIVLVNQEVCRGWRFCVSACPYKKVFYNWESGKAEKCIGCYPRVESGMPTVCSESCVGRIRYNGVILYDADRIEELASTVNEQDLYEAQCRIFLDPNDPKVIEQARKDGVPADWIEAAKKSPIWKMAMEWKIAFPMHPEFRTLPMVWYVPPLSPVQSHIDQGKLPTEADGCIPKADTLRLPVKYLANLLTAGNEKPIRSALNRMIAMRSYMRSVHVEGKVDTRALETAGISEDQAKEMYRYLAIANYEDRFVIPTGHEELRMDDAYGFQGQNGFTFGNDSSRGISKITLFPSRRKDTSADSKQLAPDANQR